MNNRIRLTGLLTAVVLANAATAEPVAWADQHFNKGYQRAIDKAIASTLYRPWITFGGTAASDARIIVYKDGGLTLKKRVGGMVKVKPSRLGKADRDYVVKWLSDSGLDK